MILEKTMIGDVYVITNHIGVDIRISAGEFVALGIRQKGEDEASFISLSRKAAYELLAALQTVLVKMPIPSIEVRIKD